MRRIILLAIVTALAMSACAAPGPDQVAQPPAQPAQVTKIDSDQLATMLQNEDFTFVTFHIPYAGEIADADLQIPTTRCLPTSTSYPTGIAESYYIAAAEGMSDEAGQELVKLGTRTSMMS